MKESYQMTVRAGDIVLMPNGTIGIVNHWDITNGGNTKEVRVYPFTNLFHKLVLTLTGKIWFYDQQINNLQPVHLASNNP